MFLIAFLTFVELVVVEAIFGPSNHKTVSDDTKAFQSLLYVSISAFVIIVNILYMIKEGM